MYVYKKTISGYYKHIHIYLEKYRLQLYVIKCNILLFTII